MREIHQLIREEIAPCFPKLAQCRSAAELHAHGLYRALLPAVRKVLETPDIGSFCRVAAVAKTQYRILAWNLERGNELDGQLEAFRSQPYLRSCDVLLLTECDVGMARSGNRAVAQELARELGLHYAFVPCYLNLCKGSGIERHVTGENELGLHGNAVLSRYPITKVRAIALKNGTDKIAGQEKRLGQETALAAEIAFPGWPVTAVAVHLDARSSQRHRRDQMRDVLDALPAGGPVVLGGDWNTTTYDSSRTLYTILGFWRRVLMGVDHVLENHYLRPDRYFERELFALLEERGFDYRGCNVDGEGTIYYDITNPQTRAALGEWIPDWCFRFLHWSLRRHGGKCPLKIDWFATRGLRSESPVVIHEVREREVPLSDHDAIGVEIRPTG